jgi:hypothetical protein
MNAPDYGGFGPRINPYRYNIGGGEKTWFVSENCTKPPPGNPTPE